MPELPEVEHLRRSLEARLVGRPVIGVTLHRRDVVRSPRSGRVGRAALLAGDVIRGLERHGKQMAIVGEGGRVVCVHLGMSGQMRCLEPRQRLPDRSHVHCTWLLGEPDHGSQTPAGGRGRLVFRDPRRFGGLWTFESEEALLEGRWGRLGPDGLDIRAADLRRRLAGTRRCVKAALLDQALVAGVGNIYADEALFAARIHPLSRADRLPADDVRRLAGAIRRALAAALRNGGSTLRDYVDAGGAPGRHVRAHAVYGRAGGECMRCGQILDSAPVAQRTTVWCGACQARWR